MTTTPDIASALGMVKNIHAFCSLMRSLIYNRTDDNFDEEMWRGLIHVFETIMADLECVRSDLDPM